MTIEDYAARILGLLCETAIRQFPDKRAMLVNYSQIPDVIWRELPGHFGLDLTAEAIEGMREAAALDAKNRNRRFEADSGRRQAEASERIRRAAEQWVEPQYKMLEQLRNQGFA